MHYILFRVFNWKEYIFLLFCFHVSVLFSEPVNFKDPSQNRNITFFLSTPKSGTNLMTGSLSAITRKPISWFYWGSRILDPSCEHRNHISYNRLGLPLITDIPLLYRTHYQYNELMQVPSEFNTLIFATRNPKELFYRQFLLQNPNSDENPEKETIHQFLSKYLIAFEVFESWYPANKMIVFYEDFLGNEIEILLHMLQLMDEAPLFIEDFISKQDIYFSLLLESYVHQHTHNSGGSSSKNGPTPIHYTKNASPKTLKYMDEYLQVNAPNIWEKYLHRFQTVELGND